MNAIDTIEALGIELPKTKDADEELGGWWGDGIKGELARKQAKRIHDDSASELLAVIERLVEQAKSDETIIATLRDMEIDENERAERAEADLAAAREEARKWEWVATHEPDNPTGLARAELEIRSGNYVEWLLARYQPGGE